MNSAELAASRHHTDIAEVREPPRLALIMQVLETLGGYRWLIALGILTTILRNAGSLGAVAVSAYIVGDAVDGASLDDLTPWLISLGALVIGQALAYWLEMWVLHDAAYRILADLRYRLYERLEELAPAYLLDQRTGDLTSTAMADVEATEIFYAHTLNILVAALVVPAGALVLLLWVHPLLALTLLPLLVAGGCGPILLRQRARVEGRRLRAGIGLVNAEMVDAVQGLREVAMFGQGEAMLARLDRHGRELAATQYSFARRKGIETALFFGLRAAAVLAMLAVAGQLVAGGSISTRIYPLAVVLALYAFEPIFEMTRVAQNFGQTFAAMGRVLHVLNLQPVVRDRSTAPPPADIEPRIDLDGVTFRYGARLPPALDGATFTVAPGETVALVGHSGAGKSTTINLLMRFWDAGDGVVAFGGHDIRDLPQTTVREMIALVPQDIYLFHTSIAENIRLGRPDATDAEVEAAARLALADGFIRELPNGYETNAGERGVQLSGGQRQRIAIARALLKDAPILLLDEAVSNLDTENEQALKLAIDRVRAGRTTLVIAHRLSTVRDADRIVVLDRGRVVEAGSHEDLVRAQGHYARLVATQSSDGTLA